MKKITSLLRGNRKIGNLKTLLMAFVFTSSTLAFSQANLRPVNVNLLLNTNFVAPGSILQADCKVRNLGNAAAPSNSNVGFYLSDDEIWDVADVRLGGGQIGQLACCGTNSNLKQAGLLIPANTPIGTYHILFVADENDDVAESDETDNVKAKEFKVGGQPDLIPTNLVSNPGPVPAGSSIMASCKVNNQGAGDAGASTLGFYFSTDAILDGGDVLLGSSATPALNAGISSGTQSASLIIPAGASGNNYILFVADKDNVISESNETNNVQSAAINVAPSAGLANYRPINIVLGAPSVPAGTSVLIEGRVRNLGPGPGGALSKVAIYLSTDVIWDGGDLELASRSIGNLNANENSPLLSANVIIPGTTPAGNYHMIYVADVDDDIAETDEIDNVKTRPVTITANPGTPDLIPVMATSTAGPVNSGSNIVVSCKVENIGSVASGGQSFVGFYLNSVAGFDGNEILLDEASVPNLAPSVTSGSVSGNLTIPGATATGSYFILFMADYKGDISEGDEFNNLVANSIDIVNVPQTIDLVPINVNVDITPAGIPAGGNVNVSCKVRNIGSNAADSSHLAYYLSSNPTYEVSDLFLARFDVEELACCGTNSAIIPATLTVPVGTAPGVWYIIYRADDLTEIPGEISSNNVKSKAFNVTAPGPFMKRSNEEIVSSEMFDLKQFPNPSQGELFVEFTSIVNANETVELQVYDQSGRLMLSKEFKDVEKGTQHQLDLTDLASGFYNMIYTSNGNVVVKKLILSNN